jgi:putative flippase GtrA
MTAKLPAQIARYAVVGLLVLALDYAVFALLLWWLPDQHLAANIAGKITGAAAGFVLHKYVTFAGQQADGTGQQALSYLMLLGFNLLLSSGLLWLLVDIVALNPYWSRLCVDGIVIASSFLGSKFWVYKTA